MVFKGILLSGFLLPLALSTCDLGQYKCAVDGVSACISKFKVCDGIKNCDDNTDEVNCSVSRSCPLDKLECKDAGSPETTMCITIDDHVCVPGHLDWDPLCEAKEDVEHCRCNVNKGGTKPVRCPVDGVCYDYENLCASCLDDILCQDNANLDKCKANPEYFTCEIDTKGTVGCLPISAMCDAYRHCYDYSDHYEGNDKFSCQAASVTLISAARPTGVYIGDSYIIEYRLVGTPRPQYKLFRYYKPVVEVDEGVTIEITAVQGETGTYTLKVIFSELAAVNYGMFDLNVWNVVDTTVDGTTGTGYNHRNQAETVILMFDGKPEATIVGAVDSNEVVVAVQTEEYNIQCGVGGDPEPTPTFYVDDVLITDDGVYTTSISAYADRALTATLTFTPDKIAHEGKNYSCAGENVLGSDTSLYHVTLAVLVPPTITEISCTDGYLYASAGAVATLTCSVSGDPEPSIYWESQDSTTLATGKGTLELEITVDATKTYTCRGQNQIALTMRSVTKSCIAVPVSAPTIAITGDGSFIEDEMVELTISVTSPNIERSVVVANADGSEIDSSLWLLGCTEDLESVTCTLSSESVKIEHTGDFLVNASNKFAASTTEFAVSVTGLRFTKELPADQRVALNSPHTFVVEVVARPTPSYAWYKDGVPITGATEASYTDESMLKEDAGVYKVVVSQVDTSDVIESSTVVEVVEDPCVTKPCQNGGECENLGNMDYSCQCQQGFSAKDCDVNDWCTEELDPCMNGGNCTTDGYLYPDTLYTCNCEFKWEDTHCTTEIDFCARIGTTKCGTQGYCNGTGLEPNGFDCFCKHTAGGTFCQLEQLCTPNPCLNDGVCAVEGHDELRVQSCNCQDGYTGDKCQNETPGWCFGKCNGRAVCYDSGPCLCEWPYHGEDCSLELDAVKYLTVSSKGNLVSATSPLLDDLVTQRVELSAVLQGELGVVLVLSETEDTTTDSVKLELSKDKITSTVNCGFNTTTAELSVVYQDKPVTITITLFYRRFTVTVVDYATGEKFAVGADLPVSCSQLNTQRLSNPGAPDGVTVGVDMTLWSNLVVGEVSVTPKLGYKSGRSVGSGPGCAVELCVNGGTCKYEIGVESCVCMEGYTGRYCGEKIPSSCVDISCTNNGYCENGYCHCPVGFYGVLCDIRDVIPAVADMVLNGGPSSFIQYNSDTPITSLEMKIFGHYPDAVGRGDIVVVGAGDNTIKLRIVDELLFLIVERGAGTGVYDGLWAAGFMFPCEPTVHTVADCSAVLKIAIDLDIVIEVTTTILEDVNKREIVVADEELPCADGFPALKSLFIQSIDNVAMKLYDIKINGVAVGAPSSGMNAISTLVGDSLCTDQCAGGSCEQSGNMVRCSGCPQGTDQITCRDVSCDPVTCKGTCSILSGCVCSFYQQGDMCSEALVFQPNTYPKTMTSHQSWVKYQSENVQANSITLRFTIKLSEATQYGQLLFIGDTAQSISLRLDDTTIKATSLCSDSIYNTLTVAGIVYNTWLNVTYTWSDDGNVTLGVGEATSQAEVPLCRWSFDGGLYLGGLPAGIMSDSAPGSVRASFANVGLDYKELSIPVGGSNLAVAPEHICDVSEGPCGVNSTSCEKAGVDYTCICKAEYMGDHCERSRDLCDDITCPANSECVEGECICSYPYGQADGCSVEISSLMGLKCSKLGNFIPQWEMSQNEFDLRFHVNLAVGLEDGAYNLVTMLYQGPEGPSYFTANISQFIDNASEGGTGTKSVLKIYHLSFDMSPGWNAVRIKLIGRLLKVTVGVTTLEYQSDIAYVMGMKFGRTDLPGYPGCLARISLNNNPMKSVHSGAGVASCSNEVVDEGASNQFGNAEVWAIVGIL